MDEKDLKKDIENKVKNFYTIHEVSELLQVTEQSVYKWIRLNKLPAKRIGGAIRIDAKDLADFIDNGKN